MKAKAPITVPNPRLLGCAIRGLPDSIADRKEVLSDILDLLDARHPLRVQVAELLNGLNLMERQQLQLALEFSKS